MTEPDTDAPPLAGPEETLEPGEKLLSLDDAVAHAAALHQKGFARAAAEIYAKVLRVRPDHIDAMHFLGIAATQLGDPESAEGLIRGVLQREPDHTDALANLGNVLKQLGKLEEAQATYERVLALVPDQPAALNNLGTLHAAAGRHDEAVAAYRKVISQVPTHVEAHHNLGNLLLKLGDQDGALAAYERAVMLTPYSPEAYRKLGLTYAFLDRLEDARKMYRRWAEIAPDDPEAVHMMAAVDGGAVPSRGSDAYVKQLFDRFAASFDMVLERLGYQAPAIVADTLNKLVGDPRGDLDILDAGCGTGLGGPMLKPFARRLIGIDLSDGMIDEARRRGVYDDFVVTELGSYMTAHPGAYDVVTAIDTLCYIGDLAETAGALSRTLKPGGYGIFTVERCDAAEAPSGYRIHTHGRYSHSLEYLQSVFRDAGLNVVTHREEVLRKERGEPVRGLAFVVRQG